MLYLSNQQWSNRLKTIETKNLRKYHRTPYWLSIGRALSPCVIEHIDGDTIVIDEEKYKALRLFVTSEAYALGQQEATA
jgi:hypothetical protein